jgi:hypothetical protein
MISKRETKQHLGRIVARRILNDAAKPDRTVTILLGTPRPHARYIWECPFLIEGLGKSEVRSAGGADQLQALLGAIASIKYCLDQAGVQYVWMNWRDLGSGIPLQVHPNGKRFEQRIRVLIERETKRTWERDLKKRRRALALSAAKLNITRRALARWEKDLKAWNPSESAREPALPKPKNNRGRKSHD